MKSLDAYSFKYYVLVYVDILYSVAWALNINSELCDTFPIRYVSMTVICGLRRIFDQGDAVLAE